MPLTSDHTRIAAPVAGPPGDGDPGPRALKVGWDGVVLVCRECQKRSSGPSKLKGKQVAKAIRGAAKRVGCHPRIVSTGCLGPCPRKAITVALAGGVTPELSVWAIASEDEAEWLGRGGAVPSSVRD